MDHLSEKSLPQKAIWDWSFLFVTPKTGGSYDDSTYASAFRRLVDRFINKGTTPHTMRSMWATWGIDSRLNEQALKELAYAMGHSLETMIKFYVRHRSPGSTGALEAVIGELLHTQAAPWLSDNIQANQIRQIMGLARSLSADNQKALLPWIQELLTEGE